MRTLSSILTALMLLVAMGAGSGFLLNAGFEAPGPLAAPKMFVVAKGESRLEIAARLERDGVISNRWAFSAGQRLQVALGTRKNAEMKHGSYEFKSNASMREVLDTLVEGKSVLGKLTIPEGLTSLQIVERLKSNESLSGEVDQVPAEGTLLPDTYFFNRGASRQELLDRMQAEHAKLVAAAWEKRAAGLPFASPQQALIMASIVEKETGRADERDRVAAVFVNRLRKNMRLQSDPTIIYGIAGGQGPLGRSITKSDKELKTAYNTYHIDGLPPTPISNPGRQAIEATLNPAQTNDLFFVADGTGGHAFTETYKEHTAAVANWRRIESETRAQKEAQAVSVAAPVQPVKINSAKAATPGAQQLPVTKTADPQADSAADETPAGAVATAAVPLPVRKPKK